MRKSKYIGLVCGEWICTQMGIAYVQPIYCQRKVGGKRVRSKSPGSRQYYYNFERRTHDGKAVKMVQLSAAQARLVLDRKKTVEEYALKKEEKRSQIFTQNVSYSFCD